MINPKTAGHFHSFVGLVRYFIPNDYFFKGEINSDNVYG